MAWQKVRKQGRDDIIVNANLQQPHPYIVFILICKCNEEDVEIRLCKFMFTTISSLPCQTFWHAIPTSFYIFDAVTIIIFGGPIAWCRNRLALQLVLVSWWVQSLVLVLAQEKELPLILY